MRRLRRDAAKAILFGMDHIDILIYAAVTVFLLSRLWAVLGRRDDDEAERPPRNNPFGSSENGQVDEEDVMVLEGRVKSVTPAILTQGGHAPASLAGALDQIRSQDPLFDEKKFLDGAKAAFTKIVGCFASGDLSPVERFLGPAVYQPFLKAIDARRAAGQTLENRIERLAAADIVAAKTEESSAILSVEFVSHQVNVLRDASGQILDGAVGQAEEVRDLWVFSRDMRSANPNWQLIETRA